MNETTRNWGLVGLGTMGSNLALNIAEHGNLIAVYNRTTKKTKEFQEGAGELADRICPCTSLESFVQELAPPRNIILMVPAGSVVDDHIELLRPLLNSDDIVIDAGNANFRDTIRRAELADSKNELFLGVGVSGGEEGARWGPSIMVGGNKSAWERISSTLNAIAGKFEGVPCAEWLGLDGAGHFVKMVHNGIEYADMQMIAEVYGLMRDGLGFQAEKISEIFHKWNEGPLKSHLIEITAKVSQVIDDESGKPILDVILDRAGQKGTGRWTVIEAQHLATSISTIEAAVAARILSSQLFIRKSGESIFGAAPGKVDPESVTIEKLENALLAGKVACYSQGFSMLDSASTEFSWQLPLPDIAKIWRAGCIIRSTMLNEMVNALSELKGEPLMFAPYFAQIMKDTNDDLREVVAQAVRSGNPVPALSTGISYFDSIRTIRSTANMIQAQRDFFGAHGFERIDKEGSFHGNW